MKGLIVKQETPEDFKDEGVTRIVVEGKENLTFTFTVDGLVAITGFKIDGDCKVIGEVDVPESAIEAALDFVRARKNLDSFSKLVGELLP